MPSPPSYAHLLAGCSVNDASGWSTARDALLLVARREHLRRTLLTAAIVGTVLFAINSST